MLIFTVLGNNIAIFYSSGLSIQLLGHWFHAVPRFIWSLLVALVIGILAVVGKNHLSTIVSNFVSLLGYWTISFTFILLMEDQWFRRRSGYNLSAWDTASKLPWGLAAVMSLLAGYLAGGVTGMAQTWYEHFPERLLTFLANEILGMLDPLRKSLALMVETWVFTCLALSLSLFTRP
jgi:purine-cytosine permease-like protein